MTEPLATPAITFDELLRYELDEISAWEQFCLRNPAALDVPFAPAAGTTARMATVGGVIHHIVAVETRYGDRLSRREITPYDAVPRRPIEALFAAARGANAQLAKWVTHASAEDLSDILEFETLSAGAFRASARKVVAHTLVHGIRTWAQLATVLRLQGHPSGDHHDLLFSDVLA